MEKNEDFINKIGSILWSVISPILAFIGILLRVIGKTLADNRKR